MSVNLDRREAQRVLGLAEFRMPTSVKGVRGRGGRRPNITGPFAEWREHSGLLIDTQLAEQLQAMRVRAMLTQDVLAMRIGRRQSFIGKIETVEQSITVAEMIQCCALMSHSCIDLVTPLIESPSIRSALAAAPPYSSGGRK